MILKPYLPDPRIGEAAAQNISSPDKERLLRIRQAGARGEGEVAHYLDYDMARDDNALLIHNLRLLDVGYSCQIDHLTVDRLLRMSVIETKNFTTDLKIEEDGTFLRLDTASSEFVPIPSPLAQARRNARFLASYIEKHVRMPRVPPLFERREPDIGHYVLINTTARIIRPEKFDTSKVIAADRYHEYHATNFDRDYGGWRAVKVLGLIPWFVTRRRMVSFGKELVSHHRDIDQTAAISSKRLQGNVDYSCRSCTDSDVEVRHGYNFHWHCKNCGTKARIQIPPNHRVDKRDGDFLVVPISQHDVPGRNAA